MKSNNIGQLSLTVTAVCLAGFTTSLPANAATLYNVLDLGIAGSFTSATGINDLGQVIGTIQANGQSFRTTPNSPINLATDLIRTGGSGFIPTGIDNLGQVVGSVFSAGLITQPNGSIRLPVVRGLSIMRPQAINDLGQVTGFDPVRDPITSLFPFRAIVIATSGSESRLDLGTLGGGSSFGIGINNLGQVVGSSTTADGQTRAFRTAPNSVINPANDDLGTLGGASSTALDINDLGQVVGRSTTTSGQLRAFLTAANSAINPDTDDLGTLGGSFSIANSLNNSGLVVGDSALAGGSRRAFLYDGTGLFDLNTLITGDIDFVLTSAIGINESGQIAATGFSADTRTSRAFLLTPVPEPASMLGLLAFGTGASFLRTRAAKQKVKA